SLGDRTTMTVKMQSFKLLQSDEELEGLPESFEAFIAARQFPARLKCASLSWEAMRDFLEE
ncbi:MAG: hypothetical protein AAFQ68_04575, partial [Bacteroidota bacterium]